MRYVTRHRAKKAVRKIEVAVPSDGVWCAFCIPKGVISAWLMARNTNAIRPLYCAASSK